MNKLWAKTKRLKSSKNKGVLHWIKGLYEISTEKYAVNVIFLSIFQYITYQANGLSDIPACYICRLIMLDDVW